MRHLILLLSLLVLAPACDEAPEPTCATWTTCADACWMPPEPDWASSGESAYYYAGLRSASEDCFSQCQRPSIYPPDVAGTTVEWIRSLQSRATTCADDGNIFADEENCADSTATEVQRARNMLDARLVCSAGW